MKKENIEIRFFFSDKNVKKALDLWKKEKRSFESYSFTDFYLIKNKNIVKIRRWHSFHRPKIELINVKRKKGLKTEKSKAVKNIRAVVNNLKKKGYKESAVIKKRRAWLIKKQNKPTYAIEYIDKLGWSGEIEVPEKDKKLIQKYLNYLKLVGAKDFSKKSLLDLFKSR